MYTKQLTILMMSLAMMVFSVGSVSAEKINCADDVDFEKYPICKFEAEWNASELFNEKLVEELGKRQAEINEDPSLFFDVYQDVYQKVERDNPGLKLQGEQTKDWIYEQIGK